MEVLLIDDLVLLGVRTTCLGTEDPCNYRHSLLLDARHKNVYNSCPLKYTARIIWVIVLLEVKKRVLAAEEVLLDWGQLHWL